jgi:hypothetical protein
MGTVSLRLLFLCLLFIIIGTADDDLQHRQRITLTGLFTHRHLPSIHFALEQINNQFVVSSNDLEFSLNKTEGIIYVDNQVNSML